ncbi:phospholipase A [Malaciobacter sp. WC5094]
MLKIKVLLIFFLSFMFGNETTQLYKKAQMYEKNKDYENAMLMYKKAFELSNKSDVYLVDLSKNQEYKVQTFTKLKTDFYEDVINKTEDKEANKAIKQILTKNFGLYPYKMNYLLPVTFDDDRKSDRERIETKFQFSIEKPITYNFFGLDESISFAYTQKSFWQTTADSAPFRETNYEPEIFVQFPYKNSETLKGFKLALNHQSNGRDKPESRSWNRIYLESYLQLSKLFVVPRIWYRIPEKTDDDNPDIEDYYGYGDLQLLYPYKDHVFELMVRNNMKFNSENKGAVQLDWTFPLPSFISSSNSYGFVQMFTGYGDSLIDYDKKINRIGFGIALSR